MSSLKSARFVQNTFREYYERVLSLDNSVSSVATREFGFVSFEGWMQRHRAFRDEKSLLSFLVESVPRDAYVSSAYYESPEAEMEKKSWLGADIVFDIDADHIQAPCDKFHDRWVCAVCGFDGHGITPEKCPSCGREKFETSTWPCEVCLNSAREETRKLLGMLMEDFGFSERELRVFFSGHRGYHVQVETVAVKSLDAVCRKEIVDYVTATGLGMSFHMNGKGYQGKSFFQFDVKNVGWDGRIASGLENLLANASGEDLAQIGIQKNVVNLLVKKRNVPVGSLDFSKGIGLKTWKKLVERAIRDQSAQVDTVVTTDTHRLIRLPKSLHGKTGFVKTELSPCDISQYDPFSDAVPFETGSVSVSISDVPEFRLGDRNFGPYRNEKVELPTSAAVLIACKNRGEIVDRNV
jgi:DNA primase small subunit